MNSDSQVDISRPLNTTVPMLMRLADPLPLAIRRGRNPTRDVVAVSRIGRIRLTAAPRIASLILMPLATL